MRRLGVEHGMVVIEFILAITLSVLLVSGLLKIYLDCQQSFHLQMVLSQNALSADAMVNILDAQIGKAGYIGCPRLTSTFNVLSYAQYSLTASNKLLGNNQEIIIKSMEFPAATLIAKTNQHSTLNTNKAVHFKTGDILLISDCKQSEIFAAARVTQTAQAQKIIPVHPLHYAYNLDAEIGRLKINHYFIAKTIRSHSDGTPIYALFVTDIRQHKTELISGINAMHFAYSIDQHGRVIDVEENNIIDWSNVLGVAIDFTTNEPPLKKIWHHYVALPGGRI